MPDFLRGLVTRVLQAETIEITVTEQRSSNTTAYSTTERVHPMFCGADLGPEPILGKEISVSVLGRDGMGRLIGIVHVNREKG